MTDSPFPTHSEINIQFAHVAYRLAERFAVRHTGISHFQTWTAADTAERIVEADIVVLSGLWSNDLLDKAKNLKLIQVCAAGFEQFDLEALTKRGVRIANGSGVNVNAVSEHALSLMLSFTRQLHLARDRQHQRQWRSMISEIAKRENELSGKTLLVYGLGAIGSRLARLGKVFDMHVIGVKRDLASADGSAHEMYPPERLLELLPHADFVVLTCPLTDATRNLMNGTSLAAMSPSSYLINVARGGCVDEQALVNALKEGHIAGAGLDTTVDEPLGEDSPLWDFENVVITPHSAGETQVYEDNVLDILTTNLERLWRGETTLVNQLD